MPDPSTITITRARETDAAELSKVLSRAFQEDPVFSWVVPDPAHRRQRLPAVFAAFVDLYLPYRETYLAGDGLAAALWAPAGSGSFGEEQLETFGERLATALGGDVERALELGAVLDQHHPKQATFYLQLMGVTPEHQGRGLGGRLLRTVLDVCDANHTPAYLEATSLQNRRLYERHDFHTIEQIDLPAGPSLWAMWRDPQAT